MNSLEGIQNAQSAVVRGVKLTSIDLDQKRVRQSKAEKTVGVQTDLRGISAHNGRLGAAWAMSPTLIVTPSLVVRSRPKSVRAGRLDAELDTPWEINLHVLYKLSRLSLIHI